MAALDARLGRRAAHETNESGEGFEGQLRCASLADLIQLQCSTRARAALRVSSDGREGHLFFDEGQIVHASAADQTGDEAVYEILNWTAGTFGKSTEPWPASPSVTTTWQYLLLSAAQRRDEMQQDFPGASTSRLVAVKKVLSSLPPPPTSKVMETAPTLPRPARRLPAAAVAPKERPWVVVNALPGVVCAARFDESGKALETRGDAAQLLALAVYMRQVAELMGENLGQSGFHAFECRGGGSTWVVFADSPRSHIAVETTALDDVRAVYRA
jgi:hypothetical protein